MDKEEQKKDGVCQLSSRKARNLAELRTLLHVDIVARLGGEPRLHLEGYKTSKGEVQNLDIIYMGSDSYSQLVYHTLRTLGYLWFKDGGLGDNQDAVKMLERLLRYLDPRETKPRSLVYDASHSQAVPERGLFPKRNDPRPQVMYLAGWAHAGPRPQPDRSFAPRGLAIDRYIPLLKLENGKFEYAEI